MVKKWLYHGEFKLTSLNRVIANHLVINYLAQKIRLKKGLDHYLQIP